MPTRRGMGRGSAVMVLLLVLASTLAGCSLKAEDAAPLRVATQSVSVAEGTAVLPLYDVAVSAIDFDPPLNGTTMLSAAQTVKLLAAIENKGTMPLSHVSVEAKLSSQRGDYTAQDRAVIERLAPGETKVVEFVGVSPATALPRSSSYRISVTADAQQPDSSSNNNMRELIVRVKE